VFTPGEGSRGGTPWNAVEDSDLGEAQVIKIAAWRPRPSGRGGNAAPTLHAAAIAGRHLIVIDRWYPSSKTCSACGHLLAELSLSTRHWTCPACRARHDRDINAAKNILAAGLAVGAGNGADACGADMRHSGTSRVRSAVKQESRPARAGIPVLQGGE